MDNTAGTDLVSDVKEYQSSIAQHLSVNVDCVRCYSDECFTVCVSWLILFSSCCAGGSLYSHTTTCPVKAKTIRSTFTVVPFVTHT